MDLEEREYVGELGGAEGGKTVLGLCSKITKHF